MQKNYLDYLPPVFSSVREFRAIAEVTDEFIRRAYEDIKAALNDLYAVTAEGEQLSHHERLYGITPRDGETNEERRFHIMTVCSFGIPYTVRTLQKKLAAICGEENVSIYADAGNCALSVALSVENESVFGSVSEMISRIVPANMTVRIIRR